MLDPFNRKITYLRVSVTDRCNIRCTYCMPAEGVKIMSKTEMLSFEEIIQVITVGAELGINKIRLTGGEPLVRKNIVELVGTIAKVPGITEVAMTTNGVLLPKYAQQLKDAGLQRVNISLDTLDAEKFSKITRIGSLSDVLAGIEAAEKAGLTPIKINMVRMNNKVPVIEGDFNATAHNALSTNRGYNQNDEQEVQAFCDKHGYDLRFIQQMDLDGGDFDVVENGHGGDCPLCNRMRLTANGYIKPCLFSDLQYSVRDLGIKEAFHQALYNKPEEGTVNTNHEFYSIGG